MLNVRTDRNHRTWNVQSSRPVAYDVIETSGVLRPENLALLAGGPGRGGRRFVVIDTVLHDLYGDQIRAYFARHDVDCHLLPIVANEGQKGFELFRRIVGELDRFGLKRRSEPIVAIGGGVLTDVLGFVAACYRRGVPYVRVPTTLMGYVDAAIGIKTALNCNGGKNRIGAFAPPVATILDRSFLKTLPRRHLINGVGEIVKLAVIKDAELFELLERTGEEAIADRFQTQGGEILRRAIHGMLEELESNLYEDRLERVVDFGHTFSPILEMGQVDDLLHGEAVAIDISFSVVLALRRGLISRSLCDQVLTTIARLGLPTYHPALDADLLWRGLEERTAHRDGRQRVPLTCGLGRAVMVNDIGREEVAGSVAALSERIRAAAQPSPAPILSLCETGRISRG
jgi:3-dehydroquinate synthase